MAAYCDILFQVTPLKQIILRIFQLAGVKSGFLGLIFQLLLVLPASADQWGSVVLAHCYNLDDNNYKEHFFVRVFWTELGGGQLFSEMPEPNAPKGLHRLNAEPATCVIDGNEVVFQTVNYRAPTLRGACGLCEHTGFRITVNGATVWEAARPEERGDPIFNGTIDMDRDMLRVCEENRPEKYEVEIPFEQDFFTARTRIVVCKTIGY